jgi:phage terminase small subunit
VPKLKKLSLKERLFIEEYKLDANATRAATGYSARSARAIGSELLTKPHVAAELDRWYQARLRKLTDLVDELDSDLGAGAVVDPAEAYDAAGNLLPVPQMPARVRRAIVSYEERPVLNEEGVQVGVIRKVKWLNKTDAKRLAYLRLGLLREQVDVAHRLGGDLARDITAEEWEALAILRHEVPARLAQMRAGTAEGTRK